MIETHPFPPFLPEGAKVLIMGTFPPQPKRWGFEFYYPNRTNDFWYILGIIFFNDKYALFNRKEKSFELENIKSLLCEKGIALSDTGYKIERLKDNASDKFLNIIEPVDLFGLLKRIPDCKGIATTGEKAADIVAGITETEAPKIGQYIPYKNMEIWRMPSTSRAYPLAVEKKAEFYKSMFHSLGIY